MEPVTQIGLFVILVTTLFVVYRLYEGPQGAGIFFFLSLLMILMGYRYAQQMIRMDQGLQKREVNEQARKQ